MTDYNKKAALVLMLLLAGAGSAAAADTAGDMPVDNAAHHDNLFKDSTDMIYNNPMGKQYTSSWKDYFAPDAGGSIVYPDESYSFEAQSPDDIFRKGREAKYNAVHGSTISPENPMFVTADHMKYGSQSGNVEAFGSVDIRHMEDRYQTSYLYGNKISQQFVIPGEVLWTSPNDVMKADRADYNAQTGVGHFKNMRGWDKGTYYFAGREGVYDRNANKMVVQNGYFTTRHAVAKVPDYRIEADSIDIYPNDHYTAHNASLFFKNHRILTLASYSGSLKHDESETNLWTLIPNPKYDNDNGFGLGNKIVVPIGGNPDLYAYAKLAWYTKAGFKPDIGIKWRTAPGTFTLRYDKEESSLNDDHVWVKKKPSFSFDSRHFYIPDTNFYTGFEGEVGQWEEGKVDGSHKYWNVYISHDPITLGPHLTFNWKAGYLKDYYGYNDEIRSNAYYKMGLNGGIGRFNAWLWYTNNNLSGYTPYSFDTYDVQKPLDFGFKYQLTRLDAVSVAYEYGTTNHNLAHLDYTYYRDMHSFYGWIMYRQKDHETRFYIQPKDFRF